MLHYALGNPLVRALTLASRPFFDQPPEGFTDVPLGRTMPVLVHAREDELAELDALDAEIAPFATLERVGEREMLDLCPVLRVGEGGADMRRHVVRPLVIVRVERHVFGRDALEKALEIVARGPGGIFLDHERRRRVRAEKR